MGKWVKTLQIFFKKWHDQQCNPENARKETTYPSKARQVGMVLWVLAVVPPCVGALLRRLLWGTVVTLLAEIVADGLERLSVLIAQSERGGDDTRRGERKGGGDDGGELHCDVEKGSTSQPGGQR